MQILGRSSDGFLSSEVTTQPLSCQISLCLPLTRTLRTRSDNPGSSPYLKTLNLVPPAKSLHSRSSHSEDVGGQLLTHHVPLTIPGLLLLSCFSLWIYSEPHEMLLLPCYVSLFPRLIDNRPFCCLSFLPAPLGCKDHVLLEEHQLPFP